MILWCNGCIRPHQCCTSVLGDIWGLSVHKAVKIDCQSRVWGWSTLTSMVLPAFLTIVLAESIRAGMVKDFSVKEGELFVLLCFTTGMSMKQPVLTIMLWFYKSLISGPYSHVLSCWAEAKINSIEVQWGFCPEDRYLLCYFNPGDLTTGHNTCTHEHPLFYFALNRNVISDATPEV